MADAPQPRRRKRYRHWFMFPKPSISYEKLGKRVEAGLCMGCGKEPCECKNLRASPPETRAARNNLARGSSFCPKPKRKRNFQRACPADQALASSNTATTPAVAILPDMRRFAHGSSARSRRAPGELHANTARQLLSVLVSVPNVADAVRQSERLGFTAGEERYVKDLGEKGREVKCGIGTFVFFEAANPRGALSAYVKQKGLRLGSVFP